MTEETILLINCIQWQRDSHGLFDYDMRQIQNTFYKIKTSKDVIRHDNDILFEQPGFDIKGELGEDYQKLLAVHKVRNKYYIEGVIPDNMEEDVDDNYLEGGDPIMKPFEM